jgi:carboxyl-terminal processing protease
LKGALFGALIAGIIFMGVFLIRYGTFAGGGDSASAVLTSDQTRRKLVQMKSIIQDTYLNEVDAGSLETGMFAGIAAGLNDPYAQYFSKEMLMMHFLNKKEFLFHKSQFFYLTNLTRYLVIIQ